MDVSDFWCPLTVACGLAMTITLGFVARRSNGVVTLVTLSGVAVALGLGALVGASRGNASVEHASSALVILGVPCLIAVGMLFGAPFLMRAGSQNNAGEEVADTGAAGGRGMILWSIAVVLSMGAFGFLSCSGWFLTDPSW